jgi:hypothetical protein
MQRVQKPIRLYVLTIFIVVSYGLMPFISAMPFGRDFLLFGYWTLPLNGSFVILFGSEGTPSLFVVLVSLALCVLSAASAVWAFYGDQAGRVATLVFVTLDVLWWTLLVLNAVLGNDLPVGDSISLVIQPLIPMGWLGFIWWNFTRADMNAFYAYQSSLGR